MIDPPRDFTVYKLGGSLLTLPDLIPRLQMVLTSRTTRPLLIVGGGKTADVVREWDQVHGLGEEVSHWLAIESLTLNSQLLIHLLPRSVLVSSREECHAAWKDDQLPVLHLDPVLRELERQHPPLPHTWEVTSDSLALWVAWRWSAGELALLKSVAAPDSMAGLPEQVDPYFPRLLGEVPGTLALSWSNLRAESPRLLLLNRSDRG